VGGKETEKSMKQSAATQVKQSSTSQRGGALSLANQPDSPQEVIRGNVPSLGIESITERAIKLQQELNEIRQQAVTELLQKRDLIDQQLRSFGWQPKSTQGEARTAAKPYPTKAPGDKMCPFCKISGHDGRAHRSQGAQKEKFTRDELIKLGFPTGDQKETQQEGQAVQ
jgi:hypothetical protein